MQSKPYLVFCICLALVTPLVSCSEKKSTNAVECYRLWYNEDPRNEIRPIHGRYWQSAHWSKEYIIYLEMETSITWRNKFIEQNTLVRADDRVYPADAPDWFKPPKNCRVWQLPQDFDDSRYFEDNLSGKMWVYEVQL